MKSIQPSSFYVFRKPLFPIQILFDLFEQKEEDSFQNELSKIMEDPTLRKAIFTSSPSLYHQLNDFSNEKNLGKREHYQKTFLKYVIRICSRPTPFGGFAGCSTIGKFSDKTEIVFEEAVKRHKRLDSRLLHDIQRFIVNQPQVKSNIKYFPNNSLYNVGEKYKYTYYTLQDNSRMYSVCSFDVNWYTEKVISAARDGAAISSIVTSLISDEVSEEVGVGFISDLVYEQILMSELEFTITGRPYINVLIDKLSSIEGCQDLVSLLEEIEKLLNSDEDEVVLSEKITRILERCDINTNSEIKTQTDLYFPTAKNTLGQAFVNDLSGKFRDLLAINQANYNYDLESFKRKFRERFEEQEIPLLVVLDSETGIGYGSAGNKDSGYLPLLQELDYSEKQHRSTIEWDFWKDFLLKKYTQSLFDNSYEIIIEQEDIAFLNENNPLSMQAPSSFSAFGNIIAASQKEVDENKYLFNLNLISGPSGANVLSRFCNGDTELNKQLVEYLKVEEDSYPGCIIAEIVHMPEEIAGNIVVRPNLRKYEIPVLASSSVEKEHQIPLEDIMVSLKEGNIVQLRSKRLNKKIIPRLSSTHNFTKGLGIYKFLCDLQYDEKYINIRWHWSILEKQKFLPRVSYKNIILNRATWNLSVNDFPDIKNINSVNFLKVLNEKFKVPRFITLCESDNELVLDIENPICRELLIEEVSKKESIVLKEYLQVPEKCFLKNEQGSFPNEIVIPFENKTAKDPSLTIPPTELNVTRKFSPGSEWLYFKIYTGEKTIDKLLKTDLPQLIDNLLEDGVINKWFLCRYSDPDSHLRLRFHGNFKNGFYNETTRRVYSVLDQYLESNIISKIQIDTYIREIERYGESTIEKMEDLFFNDSNSVLKFLHLLHTDSSEDTRWLFALKGVDALLDDFNCSLTKKIEILDFLTLNFGKEFKHIKNLKKQIDLKFRNNSKEIEGFLDKEFKDAPILSEIDRILKERSLLNKKTIDEISLITNSTDDLMISLLHMFLNRLFVSQPRLQEYIIYHHLHKYLKAIKARMKYHQNA